MKVRAIVNFEYPASLTVRNKIREAAARGKRVPMEERGRIAEVVVGEELDAPADLVESWLANGYVQAVEVGNGTQV
jgi:hypothetical protein